MESSLTNAYKIKLENFEGPFDLLFHLIEKNQVNIYDIPINEITDQYMEYLFAMQELDLEIASEFLVMAATLLHIKSRMLLPEKKEKVEEESDPREELVLKLLEYKKYKQYSQVLKEREGQWEKVFYKLPEVLEFHWEEQPLELSSAELQRIYLELLRRNRRKLNTNASNMAQILQHEKVSLKSKMREIVRVLIHRTYIRFSDIFSLKKKSKIEVVTGFMAMLELSKLKKVRVEQQQQFADILIVRTEDGLQELDEEKIAVDNE